ncbi:hypothetical protein EYZ11_002025 [Aspergillus tanneri]|uniref:Uncharacterized protein n=1 Tax=Aspergillus tanneri TaxID=1220188 RepID=A0A4S3JTK9_9EURO|nr:hypothetical protein EYZ11_002025 [Aspergillus tanneri]
MAFPDDIIERLLDHEPAVRAIGILCRCANSNDILDFRQNYGAHMKKTLDQQVIVAIQAKSSQGDFGKTS